jgi:(S)-ureidoglycine aminohydrolase
MISQLGLTRSVIRPNYALITPDSFVASVFPGWTNCGVNVLISAGLGAKLSQYLITLAAGGVGLGETAVAEWFCFVTSGKVKVNGVALTEGGFAYLPPRMKYEIRGQAKGAKLLVFKKVFEPLAGRTAPAFFAGNERNISETPFLGDPHARLKNLIPDSLATDLAVNIFTFDPGATLPFVETHVMEHGILLLAGGGVYRLNDEWHPVAAGDAIWIAPYCPQWFIASGPQPARYIYYKDINRLPQ